MQVTISLNIPESENWTPEMSAQWVKDNILNPAMIAHSESAVNLMETNSETAQQEAKNSHIKARHILLAQVN